MAQRLKHCLDEGLGEIEVSVKMQTTRDWTERPRGALLQSDIELWYNTYSISGRLRNWCASISGATLGIPLLLCRCSNQALLASAGTVSDGQFDWGGRLLNSNGVAPRSPQCGWKSHEECKGIRRLDCKTYRSSRYESRA